MNIPLDLNTSLIGKIVTIQVVRKAKDNTAGEVERVSKTYRTTTGILQGYHVSENRAIVNFEGGLHISADSRDVITVIPYEEKVVETTYSQEHYSASERLGIDPWTLEKLFQLGYAVYDTVEHGLVLTKP